MGRPPRTAYKISSQCTTVCNSLTRLNQNERFIRGLLDLLYLESYVRVIAHFLIYLKHMSGTSLRRMHDHTCLSPPQSPTSPSLEHVLLFIRSRASHYKIARSSAALITSSYSGQHRELGPPFCRGKKMHDVSHRWSLRHFYYTVHLWFLSVIARCFITTYRQMQYWVKT